MTINCNDFSNSTLVDNTYEHTIPSMLWTCLLAIDKLLVNVFAMYSNCWAIAAPLLGIHQLFPLQPAHITALVQYSQALGTYIGQTQQPNELLFISVCYN